MTFSEECKRDLIENQVFENCCSTAHLYGLLCFAKSFTKHEAVFSSEYEFVIEHVEAKLNEFGIPSDKLVRRRTKREFILSIAERNTVEKLLFDFGYSGDEISLRIKDVNFMCDGCKSAFIAGCFLSSGTITNPIKGYHLEFSTHRKNLCDDYLEILTSCGFEPKVSRRSGVYILYFKSSSQIEDILTYMGASDSSLKLMEAKVYKDVVNRVNRRTNCENANIDKIVNSAASDIADIRLLRESSPDSLSGELLEIAELREENPELSLAELGELIQPKISKSGVSHRLRRIRELANKQREQSDDRA